MKKKKGTNSGRLALSYEQVMTGGKKEKEGRFSVRFRSFTEEGGRKEVTVSWNERKKCVIFSLRRRQNCRLLCQERREESDSSRLGRAVDKPNYHYRLAKGCFSFGEEKGKGMLVYT